MGLHFDPGTLPQGHLATPLTELPPGLIQAASKKRSLPKTSASQSSSSTRGRRLRQDLQKKATDKEKVAAQRQKAAGRASTWECCARHR